MQDEQGFIWAATLNGLNRFDGRNFENFYMSADRGSISGNRIKKILLLPGGLLGVCTVKGFCTINTKTLAVQRFEISDSTRLWLSKNDITDVMALPDGGLLLTTVAGFYVTDKKGRFTYRYDHFTLADLEANKQRIFFGITIFRVSDDEYLLYYQDTQLGIYDRRKNALTLSNETIRNKWKEFVVPDTNWTIKKQISRNEFLFLPFIKDSIYYYNIRSGSRKGTKLPLVAHKQYYWNSYINFINDSLFAINCQGRGFNLYHLNRITGEISTNAQIYLPGYKCNDIFADKEGRLWISTNAGLVMQQIHKKAIQTVSTLLPYDSKDYETNTTSIYKEGNKIFVGRYSYDNGILVYDDKTGQLIKAINFFGGNNRFNGVFALQSVYKDTLWASTESGMLWLHTGNYTYGLLDRFNKMNMAGHSMSCPMDNVIWFYFHYTNRILKYDITTRQLSVFSDSIRGNIIPKGIKHILTDSYGDTWFGGAGLYRYNRQLNRFDTAITQFIGNYPLESRIGSLRADRYGSLWLTTIDNGLLEYKIKERRWTLYGKEYGIPEGLISTFSPVVDNMIWFASGTNLYCFNILTKKCAVYNESAGLPGKNITSEGNKYYYDPETKKLFFALADFYTTLPYKEGDLFTASPVFFKQITVQNTKIINDPDSIIHLRYNEYPIGIRPAVMDFEGGPGYIFEYTTDANKTWNRLGENPLITLDRLSPGEHIIHVRATSMNGAASFKKLILLVGTPFWKTWWFLLLAGCLFTGLGYFVYRRRVKSIRDKAQTDRLLAEFEMKALHAQMNPHFIFNCLNSIKGLILHNKNTEASEYLTRFSSLVRLNLEHSRRETISLQENIEYLEKYIMIEALRNQGLNWQIEVSENIEADKISIAPMLLQPIVENAIWHGLGTVEHKQLTLRFRREGDRMYCVVEDNGVGIKHSLLQKENTTKASVGLSNIRERIALLNEKFGTDYQLKIADRSGENPPVTGTTASLIFTIKNYEHD